MGNIDLGPFISGIVIIVALYAINALATNLKFGTAGLVDFGTVAYFAVGAYAFVLVTAPHPTELSAYKVGLDLPLWVGFLAAPIAAGLFSLIIGPPALRLSGDYLAIATYAAAEVLRAVLSNEAWLANGVVGFVNLRQPFRSLFDSSTAYQYFYMVVVLVVLFVTYIVLNRMNWGPFGRSLRSIRENPDVALSVGKNVPRYRLKAFVVGGLIGGFTGALYVTFARIILPNMFVAEVTFVMWIGLIIGGLGNYRGAILGTAILVTAQELTRFVPIPPQYAPVMAGVRWMIMGILLMVILRYWPKGMLPERHPVDPPPRQQPLARARIDEPMPE